MKTQAPHSEIRKREVDLLASHPDHSRLLKMRLIVLDTTLDRLGRRSDRLVRQTKGTRDECSALETELTILKLRADRRDHIGELHEAVRQLMRLLYLDGRTNGGYEDNPGSDFPRDGVVCYTPGKEWIVYNEGQEDRKWMEDKDTKYLMRILREGRLRSLEPAVWFLRKQEDPQEMCDIGLWWRSKLAFPNIGDILAHAEQDYKKFAEGEAQERAAKEAQEKQAREAREAAERAAQAHLEELRSKLQTLIREAKKLIAPIQKKCKQLQFLPSNEHNELQSFIDHVSFLNPTSLDEAGLDKDIAYIESRLRDLPLSALPQRLDRLALDAEAEKIKQESELKAKQKAELKAKRDAELKAKAETELKSKQAAELKAKAKAEAKGKELEARKEKVAEQAKAKEIASLRKEIEGFNKQARIAVLTGKYNTAIENYVFAQDCYEKLSNLGMDCKKNLEELETKIKEAQAKLESQTTSHSPKVPANPAEPSSSASAATVESSTSLSTEQPIIMWDKSYEVKPEKIMYGDKEVGQGSYGTVYLGKLAGSDVAIKELSLKSLPEKIVNNFKAEAMVMAKLHHPNIVQLLGVCLKPNHYCIVMEYMKNGSLYNLLYSSREMSWNFRIKIAKDIAAGLSYLHDKNVLHCDLKSLNILFAADYTTKLSDFGLAKIKSASSSITSMTIKSSCEYTCKIMLTAQDTLNSLEIGFFRDADKIFCKLKDKEPLLVNDKEILSVLAKKFAKTGATFTDDEQKQILKFTLSKGCTRPCGTLAWLAPEVVSGRAPNSKGSDVYSCGVVFWEIAARQIPFPNAPNPDFIGKWIKKGNRGIIPEGFDCYLLTSPPDDDFKEKQPRSAYIFTADELFFLNFFNEKKALEKIAINSGNLSELKVLLGITKADLDEPAKQLNAHQLQSIKDISGHIPPAGASCLPFYATLITRCWQQRAKDRPCMSEVLQELQGGMPQEAADKAPAKGSSEGAGTSAQIGILGSKPYECFSQKEGVADSAQAESSSDSTSYTSDSDESVQSPSGQPYELKSIMQ